MKFFGKINRGLILTILVLIVVTIYLVTQSISQAGAKLEIKEVCQKYINTAISYKALPEKYRKDKPIAQAELEKYIDDMSKDLKAFYTDNEQNYKNVIARNKEDLERQAKGEGVVFSYKKDIKEYKNFTFEDKTVTVTIGTNSVLDGPDITTPGMPRKNVAAQTTDTITLQKVDGKWKIIYADLQQPIEAQRDNGTVMYRTVN